jgi:hypothetical protein
VVLRCADALRTQDWFAEAVTTRVILPEGSADARTELGRLRADVGEERTFTYLDAHFGRPTVVITTRRASPDQAHELARVSYAFSPAFALLEPALLVAAFAVLLASVLCASRLDLTIVRGPEWHRKQVRPTHCPP